MINPKKWLLLNFIPIKNPLPLISQIQWPKRHKLDAFRSIDTSSKTPFHRISLKWISLIWKTSLIKMDLPPIAQFPKNSSISPFLNLFQLGLNILTSKKAIYHIKFTELMKKDSKVGCQPKERDQSRLSWTTMEWSRKKVQEWGKIKLIVSECPWKYPT